MLLAIDIGNSNIITGCIKDDTILFEERFKSDTSKTDLEYIVIFNSIMNLYNITKEDIDGVIISSVVPPLNKIMVSAIEKLYAVKPLLVGPGVKTGVNVSIENPTSIGTDIMANAVGALNSYNAPLITIDMGTATTIGVINDKKCYVGGMIIPGVKVSLDSLVDSTSQLPNISLEAPKNPIGRNTIDCMKSGIIYGNASLIDGIIDRIWESLGYETKVIATGGMASSIIPYCKHNITIDNTLILKGLNCIYKKNTDKNN